jgi:hypothetical protein
MVEEAALAIAAADTSYVTVEDTVHFLNSSDHSNPPDWRMKRLITQHFINYTTKKHKDLQDKEEPAYLTLNCH